MTITCVAGTELGLWPARSPFVYALLFPELRAWGRVLLGKYFWQERSDIDGEAVMLLKRELGIPEAGARLLVSRSFTDPPSAGRYLFPDASQSHDPFTFRSMGEAVSCLQDAVENGKRILIHGDYDVDGVSGTAILYHYLGGLFPEVFRFLPDRRRDGYGLSQRAVEWAIENGVGLVITVDCGTSDSELVSRLLGEGIDVIICDHHELPLEGGVPGIVLNPVLEGESYPFRFLCGAGVAFKLVEASEKRGMGSTTTSGELLDLVALATVGDVAPLIDENRYLVRRGLDLINDKARVGIEVLRESSGFGGKEIKASHLSFVFAPRLNAPGRVSRARPSLEILCTSKREEAEELARLLERENSRRRELTGAVTDEVMEMIAKMGDLSEIGGFVMAKEGWDEGVLGIVAARIAETFGKPAILISVAGELGKGSGRSVPGVNLKEQLNRCKSYLLRYGGHSQAVGLTIESPLIASFEREFSLLLKETARDLPPKPVLTIDAELGLADCSLELVEFICSCEPFGLGNSEPVWKIPRLWVREDSRVVGNGHLKLFLQDEEGGEGEAIYFNWGYDVDPAVLHGRVVDIAVQVRKGFFRDQYYPELRLVDMRESGDPGIHRVAWQGRQPGES